MEIFCWNQQGSKDWVDAPEDFIADFIDYQFANGYTHDIFFFANFDTEI